MKTEGFCFGIDSVDRTITSIRPGNYVVISAETSGGKSLMAEQAAFASAMRGLGTAAFSFEMTRDEFLDRGLLIWCISQ
jgi:replicative DNA helicase